MAELRIDFPRHGDVVSHHDGTETANGLAITVRGQCPSSASVTVNGARASVVGSAFQAQTTLAESVSSLVATDGKEKASSTILYDRNSFPRYRLSVDDNIWVFSEIGRNPSRYGSLFDHWYLAFFKKVHDDFGTQVHMNIYFEEPEVGFDLTQFPDKYKREWEDNSDWLRLSFHALSNDCYSGKIYKKGSYETIMHDCQKVTEQILRFAGEKSLCRNYTTLHWAETTPDGARALRDCGFKGLTGRFGFYSTGAPVGTRYHLGEEENAYLMNRNMYYEPELRFYIVNCPQFLNGVQVRDVVPFYDSLLKGTDTHVPFDVIDLLVHEEHFWRGYEGYQADNPDRVLAAVRWATDRGLKPVQFDKGIAGNASWE